MSRSEITRLRSLLTARGDAWDLRWDLAQLESAWRNEVVTIPVCTSFFCMKYIQPLRTHKDNSPLGSHNTHWNFVPTLASTAVPHAKVYLKADVGDTSFPDLTNSSPSDKPAKPNEPKRYSISLTVNGLDESTSTGTSIATSMYIVKGNPLILSSSPLPCFSTGTSSIPFEVRSDEDISELSLQVILTETGSHFAFPIDELLGVSNSSASNSLQRTMTLWDTQNGSMRGSANIALVIKREDPLSIAELMVLRRSQSSRPPERVDTEYRSEPKLGSENVRHEDPIVDEEVLKKEMSEGGKGESNFLSEWTQKASDLLSGTRAMTDPVGTDLSGANVLVESPRSRRRRGPNFTVQPDTTANNLIEPILE